MGTGTRIGVISDTHGLLRPEALAALDGCTQIIHAGDVGKPEALEALRALAPLHVIAGNIDANPGPRVYHRRWMCRSMACASMCCTI
ncbi:hypothetical protein DXO170_19200 [Xanthomonas oryzae pv. oryzae]|nr:hypothetical protein PXO_03670 [Xanthomonas oryzae pv. oryzae PXO99A]AJQ81378.1 hypothetical protein AZ54_00930 [Xanthomonas oryzae pv. oryzae PXO86]ALZ73904.1 hypothetical protein APZ20_00845 [Xanthomonas oryzae pv. oryzae]BAE66927.1 conserved hypothetical protein [Xanthomonas oryzae pv. oryzae MAFF 311018]AOS00822.1 hypothetical protein ATY42_00820 [Xanthomonas oryzae pv. oryzae]